MEQVSGFTKGRLIAFLCCCLLSIAGIFLGISILSYGTLFTVWICVAYFILPLLAASVFGWCIFSQRKVHTKVLLGIFIAVGFGILSFLLYIAIPYYRVNSFSGEEIKVQYATVKEESPLMPELEEIGDPEQTELYRTRYLALFWTAETYHLVCQYTPDEYEEQKALLEADYVFQTEDFTYCGDLCQCSARVGEYEFRILSPVAYENDYYYPKDFMLIGTSDKDCRIVYMAFEDHDLDYIPSLGEFILDDCCWKYIS